MKKPKLEPGYVRVPSEMRRALEARCEKERRTLQAVVTVALEAYLKTEVMP
jgi:hypothetical protein